MAVESGLKNLDVPRDMARLWPSSKHSITYFSQLYGRPVWKSRMEFCGEDRRVELWYDTRMRPYVLGVSIRPAGGGSFGILTSLLKHESVTNDGRRISAGTQRALSRSMWDEFIRQGGTDLSILGIEDCEPCANGR